MVVVSFEGGIWRRIIQHQLPVKAIDSSKNSVYCSTPTIDIEPKKEPEE